MKEEGYKIGLASSGNMSDIENNLSKHGLKKYFDVIASGEEVEFGKPSPDVFLLAAERLNISPKDCLVLEDSKNGIIAAQKAGMKSIMVPDIMSPDKDIMSITEIIVKNLYDVILFLKNK